MHAIRNHRGGRGSNIVMKAKKSDDDGEITRDINVKEISYDISHLKKDDFGVEPGAFSNTETEALRYHAEPTAGKYTI
jgi:hypothetical protein